MSRSSSMLITELPEIDLFESLKYDKMRNNGILHTYSPNTYRGYVDIQLCRTKVRYGWRIWFQAPCCQRRTSKLYIYGTRVACRQCLNLKYPSQYSNDPSKRLDMTNRKQERLLRQKRRMWHGYHPTRFGAQYSKLKEESDALTNQMIDNIGQRSMKMDTLLAKAKVELGIE